MGSEYLSGSQPRKITDYVYIYFFLFIILTYFFFFSYSDFYYPYWWQLVKCLTSDFNFISLFLLFILFVLLLFFNRSCRRKNISGDGGCVERKSDLTCIFLRSHLSIKTGLYVRWFCIGKTLSKSLLHLYHLLVFIEKKRKRNKNDFLCYRNVLTSFTLSNLVLMSNFMEDWGQNFFLDKVLVHHFLCHSTCFASFVCLSFTNKAKFYISTT